MRLLPRCIDSKNSWRRREARFLRAQTLRHAGRYEEALTALEEVRQPRAVPERLLSLAGAGRVPEAMALADSLVARGDTTQPWDSLLVSLGRQDPSSASSLVDRVRRLPNRPAETRARWLLDDGRRLVGSDTARARSRFREAVKIGGAGDAAGRASLELARLDLLGVRQPRELSPVIRSLRANAERLSECRERADRAQQRGERCTHGDGLGDAGLSAGRSSTVSRGRGGA